MKPKFSIKGYANELKRMTGKEMLTEYLAKVVPMYLVMSLSNSYSISFEELAVMGLKDLGVYEVLELVESVLTEHFDDVFEVEYEYYWCKVDDQFIKITIK